MSLPGTGAGDVEGDRDRAAEGLHRAVFALDGERLSQIQFAEIALPATVPVIRRLAAKLLDMMSAKPTLVTLSCLPSVAGPAPVSDTASAGSTRLVQMTELGGRVRLRRI